MKSVFALGAALVVAAATVGCGESPIAATPPGQLPFVTPLGGLWSGSLTLTGASGGECVGNELRAAAAAGTAPDQGTVSVTQDGSDVAAIVRSATTGLTCDYKGTSSLNSFALSAVSCSEEVFYQCADGSPRVLVPIGSTLTATQSGTTASGVVATSYNVFSINDNNERKPLAALSTRSDFTASRR